MITNIDKQSIKYEQKPYYTGPLETEIRSIPTVIVDPHNEVLPFWMRIKDRPALLLHIDRHDDLGSLELRDHHKAVLREGEIRTYVKNIPTGCFIIPAIYLGIVDKTYWHDPEVGFVKLVTVSTRMGKSYITGNSVIVWNRNEPIYDDIEFVKAPSDINKSNRPIILDIDLDAFLSIRDKKDKYSNVLSERLMKTKEFLKLITRKPSIITIARSQTPMSHVPPERVNEVQELTIKMLKEAF